MDVLLMNGHGRLHLLLLILVGLTGLVDCGRASETVMARAGETATVPCPGLSDSGSFGGYLVNQLLWSCASRRGCPAADDKGRLAEYVARSVRVSGDRARVSLDPRSWSLLLAPVKASDAASYSCSFNSQIGERRLVRLLVLDVPSAPGRPVVLRHSSREVQLSWAPSFQHNNSPIQHYIVQTRRGELGNWPPVEEGHRTAGNATNTTVGGLVPFSVYTFRVSAVNGLGVGHASETSYPVSTLRERPGAAPRLTGVTNVSAVAMRITWQPAPAASLHGEFTYYRLTYRRPDRPDQPPAEVLLHDRAQRAHVIDGLQPYTQYEITLQVKNPEDLGPPASITAITGEAAPSRPENVSVSEIGDRSLTLTWLPPNRTNGVIQAYQVYWRTAAEPEHKRRLKADTARSVTLSNLEPDTEYTVWMTATTGAGEGKRSSPVRSTTDVSGPGPPDITNITCPTDVTLGLQWRRPDRLFGPVDRYYVLYRHGDSWDYVERVVPVRSTQLEYSILLPNLTSKQIYEIRIQGATVSKLVNNKVYKGQQSLPRKVRMERGCEEIQPYSTWKHRPRGALAGSELTAIFVSCLLLLFIIVMAAIWRRRQKRYPSPRSKQSPAGPVPGWAAPAHDAVPCHLFVQHVRQLHLDDGEALRRQWETLQLRAPPMDTGQTTDAQQKAKQNGVPAGSEVTVLPYEPARVPVRSRLYRARPAPAVYAVDGYRRARAYLVSGRPAAAEYDALWRLVWEQGVHTVVLFGSLATYSDQFWPEPGCIRASVDLQVEGQSEHTLATCVVRSLTLSKLKGRSRSGRRPRRVELFQYTCWPEYGLPENPLPLLELVQRTSEHAAAAALGPVLVMSGCSHSSLSLYVGLATLLSQLRERHELAVFSYWHHVIGQCPYLLTTLEEYSLLYDCLLERVTSGVTSVPRDQVSRYTQELQGGQRNSYPYPAAERQYMSVVTLEAHQYMVTSAVKPYNQPKNSCLGFLPVEASRVCLTPKLSIEGSDYINASWFPGFRQLQEYVVTQHPLPNTVLDFWQMVWDNRVTTAVCLTPEECGVFWPLEEEEIDCESFLVRHMSQTFSDDVITGRPCTIRSFLMESLEGEDDVTIRLVHVPCWPTDVPLGQVMAPVQRVIDLHGERRTPLVVIDRHGGTEAASFCLLGAVLRQLQYEARFDVFTYAKLYHQRRPGIWRTVAEYMYLYHVVEAWLSSSTTAVDVISTSFVATPQTPFLEARLDGVDGVIV